VATKVTVPGKTTEPTPGSPLTVPPSPEDPEAGPAIAEVAEPSTDLVGEVADLRAKLEEASRRLLYLQAEMENLRKAAERERLETGRYAAAMAVERILPFLDELDAAVSALPPEHAKGIALVRDNAAKALGELGLREIPAEGRVFDPYVHEAVETVVEGDGEDGAVVRVLRKGYQVHNKVLRPSLVAVLKRGD